MSNLNPDLVDYKEKNAELFNLIDSYILKNNYNYLKGTELIKEIKKNFPLLSGQLDIQESKYTNEKECSLTLFFPENTILIYNKILNNESKLPHIINVIIANKVFIDIEATQIKIGLIKLDSEYCDYRIFLYRNKKNIILKDYLFEEDKVKTLELKDENNTQKFLDENFDLVYNQIKYGNDDLKDLHEMRSLMDDKIINEEIKLFVSSPKFRNLLDFPEIKKLEKKNIIKKFFKL